MRARLRSSASSRGRLKPRHRKIEGGFGNDTLLGGDGDDVITDAGGDDRIEGGEGNDVIQAGNMMAGGVGNLILGGDGKDFIITTMKVKNASSVGCRVR